jgi:hypothetical protein
MSFADLIIAAQTRATRHSSSSPSPDSPSDLTLDSGVHLCPLRVQASIGSEPNPTFYKGRGPPPRAGQRQPLRSGPPRASSFLVCSLSAASPALATPTQRDHRGQWRRRDHREEGAPRRPPNSIVRFVSAAPFPAQSPSTLPDLFPDI